MIGGSPLVIEAVVESGMSSDVVKVTNWTLMFLFSFSPTVFEALDTPCWLHPLRRKFLMPILYIYVPHSMYPQAFYQKANEFHHRSTTVSAFSPKEMRSEELSRRSSRTNIFEGFHVFSFHIPGLWNLKKETFTSYFQIALWFLFLLSF